MYIQSVKGITSKAVNPYLRSSCMIVPINLAGFKKICFLFGMQMLSSNKPILRLGGCASSLLKLYVLTLFFPFHP